MVRLADLSESEAQYLSTLECPSFDTEPFVTGPPLALRKVAIITSAGLHRRDQDSFGFSETGYRVLPGDIAGADLVMSHVSVNFDRTGFQQDVNVVFPIDRLRELARDGTIGATANYHYSLMGAPWHPVHSQNTARELAGLLKRDAVNAVILAPV